MKLSNLQLMQQILNDSIHTKFTISLDKTTVFGDAKIVTVYRKEKERNAVKVKTVRSGVAYNSLLLDTCIYLTIIR